MCPGAAPSGCQHCSPLCADEVVAGIQQQQPWVKLPLLLDKGCHAGQAAAAAPCSMDATGSGEHQAQPNAVLLINSSVAAHTVCSVSSPTCMACGVPACALNNQPATGCCMNRCYALTMPARQKQHCWGSKVAAVLVGYQQAAAEKEPGTTP